ncbi:hypothetical protein EVAR_18961_1 [Eumeta japonica]|uniref:Uncharacterized protein n=1 Tax=Eumeta variegata TaxID=151549 RepID=A0A4C1WXS4_EUMVA|nr:hypothetical protein EVAR_18961_1 [Eumeta japonica]
MEKSRSNGKSDQNQQIEMAMDSLRHTKNQYPLWEKGSRVTTAYKMLSLCYVDAPSDSETIGAVCTSECAPCTLCIVTGEPLSVRLLTPYLDIRSARRRRWSGRVHS